MTCGGPDAWQRGEGSVQRKDVMSQRPLRQKREHKNHQPTDKETRRQQKDPAGEKRRRSAHPNRVFFLRTVTSSQCFNAAWKSRRASGYTGGFLSLWVINVISFPTFLAHSLDFVFLRTDLTCLNGCKSLCKLLYAHWNFLCAFMHFELHCNSLYLIP